MRAVGAHQPTFFSFQGPAKALPQQEPELREFKVTLVDNSLLLINFAQIYV